MVHDGKIIPLFFCFNEDLKAINDNIDAAKDKLLERNPIFYNKLMFRSFLNYSGEELENMGIEEYLDCTVVLGEVLKMWHAPYLKHD